jgi:hypothetical protein
LAAGSEYIAGKFADFELPLLDLLDQFDATNDNHQRSEAMFPESAMCAVAQ